MTKETCGIGLEAVKLCMRVIAGIFGCIFSVFIMILPLAFGSSYNGTPAQVTMFFVFAGLLGLFLSLHFMIPNKR